MERALSVCDSLLMESCMNIRAVINEQRLVETFIRYVSIDSPPLQEELIGAELAQTLTELGCVVEIARYEGSFNIIARKSGSDPALPWLLLGAHMDTVESTAGIAYCIENGVIRSIGDTILGADDKSAIAQIIEALRVLDEQKLPHANLEILFTSAEERGLIGVRNLDISLLRSAHGIILDVSGPPGAVVVAAPTREMFSITVQGRAAHAGIEPEAGINAIRVAAEIVAALPNGRIDERTTLNISEIRGGSATNIVPEQACLHGEFRAHEQEQCEAIRAMLHDIPSRIAAHAGAGVAIAIEREYEAFAIAPDEPFLQFAEEVIGACGLQPKHLVTGGGSDGNILNRSGLCCLNLSNGMSAIHSHQEHIAVTDLVTGAEMLVYAACRFPAFAAGRKGAV
jgi:tripeptide aminopeptidase